MKGCLIRAVLALVVVPAASLNLQAFQGGAHDEPEETTIPEGTEFKLQLHTTINSKAAKAGDRVMTSLLDPVAVEDREVLPKGVRIDGHIGDVKPAARRGKGGYLTIVFDTIELPSGEKVAIVGSLTEVFMSEGGGDPKVGPEGDLKGGGASLKKRAAIVLIPTGAAAAAGTGPAVAAGVGGMVAAILLPHGQEAVLLAGSLIGMRLDRDVTFSLPAPHK